MNPVEGQDPELLHALFCRLEKISGFALPSVHLTGVDDFLLETLPQFSSSLSPLDVEDPEGTAEDVLLAAKELLSPTRRRYAPTAAGMYTTTVGYIPRSTHIRFWTTTRIYFQRLQRG